MKLIHVCDHPLVKSKLTQLRDKTTSSKKFSELVGELALLLTYEACADLEVERRHVQTPLAAMLGWHLKGGIRLFPIMRAGLGMVESVKRILPNSRVWHVGIFREEDNLQPVVYYKKLPDSLATETCLVLDPMLATGGTAVAVLDMLKERQARRTIFIGLIGAPEGVELLKRFHPETTIFLGSLDEGLNDLGYIVPGLGDAGDRQFGTA